jgi:hypothetical protein
VPKAAWDWFWIALFCAVAAALGFEALTASQKIPEQQHSYGTNGGKQSAEGYHAQVDEAHPPEQTSKRKQKQDQTAERLKEFSIEFLNLKLSDAIIAIFTVVLAVKTAGLFKETAGLRSAADQQARDMKASIKAAEIAAEAAELSANALTQAERAHIYIKILSQNFVEAVTGEHPHVTSDGFVNVPVEIAYCFKNYGKTPAIIKEMSRDIAISTTFPDEVEYLPADLTTTERVIAADENTGPQRYVHTYISKVDLNGVIRANTSYWFYGRVLYDDVFGTEHEHRFIYRYNGARGWRSFHHPEYSKST